MTLSPELTVWLCGCVVMDGGELVSGTLFEEVWKLTVRLSRATPWSLPESLTSNQRRNISCPGGTVTPFKTMFVNTCWLVGLLPSRTPAVAPVVGVVKFSAVKAVQLCAPAASELVIGLPLTRYEKTSFCALVLPPLRHCSPVQEMVMFVAVSAVSFMNRTP